MAKKETPDRAARAKAREAKERANRSNPKYLALIQRSGSISAVRSADIGQHGLSLVIQPLDAEAASDVLDLLSQFGLKPDGAT